MNGPLAIEKDACVAMTGCFGSDDIELTIMSSHVIGSTGFVWTKEGIVHAVDVDKKVWYFQVEMSSSWNFSGSSELEL